MMKQFLSAALAAFCLVSCSMKDDGVAITAHRGFWNSEAGGHSENSLAALRAAQDERFWGSEFDVHLTADSVVVVNHDATFHGRKIHTSPLDSLLPDRLPDGETIPTLDAYLAQGAASPRTVLVFELKQHESPEREDLTHLEICSIDDEWTREIDDALSLETLPDGDFQVGIHLANPSFFVHKDDLLDKIAAERPLSLYLPTTTVTMFPEHLGCDLASLNEGQLRPAMSFLVQMKPDGEILDWRFCPSRIRVTHRLTYVEADRILQEAPENDRLGTALRGLKTLAEAYQRIREEAGAVSLNRPELKLHVEHDVITAEREDQETPSHNLVREFMVMAHNRRNGGVYLLAEREIDGKVVRLYSDNELFEVDAERGEIQIPDSPEKDAIVEKVRETIK